MRSAGGRHALPAMLPAQTLGQPRGHRPPGSRSGRRLPTQPLRHLQSCSRRRHSAAGLAGMRRHRRHLMLPEAAQRHGHTLSTNLRGRPAALAMVIQGGLSLPPPRQAHRLQPAARSGPGGRPAARPPRQRPQPRLQSCRQPRRNPLQETGSRRRRRPQQAGASATGGAPVQSAAARAQHLGRPAMANPVQVPSARCPRRPPWSSGPLAAALPRRSGSPRPRRSHSACRRSARSMRRRSFGLRLGDHLARRRAPWHASRRRRPQAKQPRWDWRWRLIGRRRGGPCRRLRQSSRL